ncbi:Z-ring associated protein ZapG [Photobacterium halotolerans]|uniref:Z-ring associated protein G n=1 Tax=Photobacterium halotolerans TaxID=265726 RepID=A0A7X4WE19_9GAMM|nr:Z-ring associated protein ZapG [Photobacterium halotolerans]NAW65665.1 DUF1043 family protein [Photobacterium halotolerans]NAW87231.1 DUF1043 family protein [Photobacterium halotolerans]NAX49336.1 DUF1043 family protein [Photobacterium halotolerans]
MAWIYAILIFAAGALVGAFAARLGNKNLKQQKELQKELDKTKYQLEQYRQELVDHFARSSDLLDNLAKDYSKLYEHMAKTSAELMPNLPEQDNPFSQRISTLTPIADEPETETEELGTHQPRDYANGASGLLRAEQKQAEAAKAS